MRQPYSKRIKDAVLADKRPAVHVAITFGISAATVGVWRRQAAGTFKPTPGKARGRARHGRHEYLNNQLLLDEVAASKVAGAPTADLTRAFLLLVDRIGSAGNFNGYSYLEDMKSAALENLFRNWMKFDPEKGDNPFAYYTTAVRNSFLRVMENEKVQTELRNELALQSGVDLQKDVRNTNPDEI